MTRDRSRTIAGVILATTIATVSLPVLVAATIFVTATAHPPSNLAVLMWISTMGFHGAFTARQWFGFAVVEIIVLSAGYVALHTRTQPWVRMVLLFLLATAAWTGWQGYRYQRHSVAIARANQALCPPPDRANRTALNFRAALDARAAADRAAKQFQTPVPINNTVSRFIPVGVSLSAAKALALDAGLNVHAATAFERDERGGDLRFMAKCDYAFSDLESQAISVAVYQDTGVGGQAKVGRTEALIIKNAL